MSESVEQAALRRAAEPGTDWKARATREAVAILDEVGVGYVQMASRDTLVALLSIAWLQGNIYGSHETLASAERAFASLRAAL